MRQGVRVSEEMMRGKDEGGDYDEGVIKGVSRRVRVEVSVEVMWGFNVSVRVRVMTRVDIKMKAGSDSRGECGRDGEVDVGMWWWG